MKTHYTIPFFIHHEGCTHRCVFCDQRNITGRATVTPGDISRTIDQYLMTMPDHASVEAAFFGGSFTGLSRKRQAELLRPVMEYLSSGRIKGIRLSTRPDLVDTDGVCFLKENGVTCVELGVQSMSDEVLSLSGRGHIAEDTVKASGAVLGEGLSLGHQIMLGLPGSSFEKEMDTAHMAVRLGASQVRIYPTVVIEGTVLAEMWKRGEYVPLSEEEALSRSADILSYFNSEGIKVLRCGLHPSEELSSGGKLLAGPFHPAFRLKAESIIFGRMLRSILDEGPDAVSKVSYNPDDECALRGYGAMNSSVITELRRLKPDGFLSPSSNVTRGRLTVERNV